MNIFKRIIRYFDALSHDIRLLNLKNCCIFSVIFFILGIGSWIICGRIDDATIFYIFPRCAISIIYAYILWGISFAFVGFIFAGVIFGCEKYKRANAYKIALFIIIMQVFTYCVYPVFFGAVAPLITFILLLIAILFCFLAIMASFKFYCLWTICISIHFLWLLYNCYVCLAFAFVN